MVGQIAGHLDKATLKQDAAAVHHQLQQVMRTFGRRCRGQGQVFVTWVRQTERDLLDVGHRVGPLARRAGLALEAAPHLEEGQRQRLQAQLAQATQAYEQIEQQSRRLIHGKPLPHAKIVNPYDRTIAPIIKGKSNCPVQFGKKPGFVAEMATGFFFDLHLPAGNPDDASYMLPLLDQLDQAIAALPARRKPRIRSVAADLAFREAALRERLQGRGIMTVGIPTTIDPPPRTPTPAMIQAVQTDLAASLAARGRYGGLPPNHHVQVAYACGYSRPFVESLVEQLACRGATQLKYKGHRGAWVQMIMAMMACNGATLVRIQQGRLTQRAHRFRRWFRLKPFKSLKNNPRIN